MEPTDQPPPTPQTWAETSAWAPAVEAGPAPTAWTPPHASVAPLPTADDYVRPAGAPGIVVRARRQRSRTGVVVLVAVLATIVAIAASANQAVTKSIGDWLDDRRPDFLGSLVESTQTYAWRLGAPDSDPDHYWPASLLRVGVVILATGLIVALLARSLRGFWRTLLAVALSVMAATQVAMVAAGFLVRQSALLNGRGPDLDFTLSGIGGGHAGAAFFGLGGPSGSSFVGSVGLGLVVGAVTGLVVWRRGAEEPSPQPVTRAATPIPPPPAFFPPAAPGIVPPGLLPPPPGALPQGPVPRDQPTSVLPSLPDEQGTAVLPPAGDPESTAIFPTEDGPGRHSR